MVVMYKNYQNNLANSSRDETLKAPKDPYIGDDFLPQTFSPCRTLKFGSLFDLFNQVMRRGVIELKDACISFFPQLPQNKQHKDLTALIGRTAALPADFHKYQFDYPSQHALLPKFIGGGYLHEVSWLVLITPEQHFTCIIFSWWLLCKSSNLRILILAVTYIGIRPGLTSLSGAGEPKGGRSYIQEQLDLTWTGHLKNQGKEGVRSYCDYWQMIYSIQSQLAIHIQKNTSTYSSWTIV